MLTKLKQKLFFSTRQQLRLLAFAVLTLAIALIAYNFWLIYQSQTTGVVKETQKETRKTQELDAIYMEESAPKSLEIPKLDLTAEFEDSLGLNQDGTIEVPESYEKLGWYKHGPTPGEIGPAVVVGHVDSADGPAIFYSIGQLEPGDEIKVKREDGSVAKFEVTKMVRVEQDDFPSEMVYGDTERAELRLITCTGTYDKETLRYSHNLIVMATLLD